VDHASLFFPFFEKEREALHWYQSFKILYLGVLGVVNFSAA
jgi:hypothetical protein